MVCGKNAEVFGMISNKYARLVVLQELPTLVEKLWHYRMQSAGIYILIDEKVLNVSKILGPRGKKLLKCPTLYWQLCKRNKHNFPNVYLKFAICMTLIFHYSKI